MSLAQRRWQTMASRSSSLPPDGPSRPGREHESTSAARRFFRTIRAELARAADESSTVLPRITNYPY